MNYCIYNKNLDQFLRLTYAYNDLSVGTCETKWISEFIYALASPENNYIPRVETAWPEDIEGQLGNYFIFIYNRIERMNNSKNGMEDINFITIIDGIPDFKREYAIKKDVI